MTKDRAIYFLYWALFLLAVLLLASGLYLVVAARPTASASYSDMERLRSRFTFGGVVSRVHVIAPWLWLAAAALLATLHYDQRSRRGAASALASVVIAIAAIVTGSLLPWDQLALWAVTTGTTMLGFDPVFGDQVGFLVGGREASIGTVQLLLASHVVLGIIVALISTVASFGRSSTD